MIQARLKTCLGFSILVLLALCGCGPKTGDQQITIGLMPKLVGIDYFNTCERGAREAARELGINLVYDGPTTNDVTKQAEMLDTWIIRKLDAIAVAPNDPNALAPTLKKAMQKGIKVLTWDADSTADSRHCFVNQATYQDIGFSLVDVMAEEIGKEGEVAIVTGSLTAANQNIWIDWMKKRMAEKYPGLKLAALKPSGEDEQLAFQVTQDLIKAYPGLKGVFGITSVSLPGAAHGVRESGKSGKIAVTGLSTPNTMRAYVKDGTVKTFILWSPVDLGYLTIQAAKKLLEGEKLPEPLAAGRLGQIAIKGTEVLLGPPIRFTKDNIDNFDF